MNDDTPPITPGTLYLKRLFYGRTVEATVANDLLLFANITIILISLYSLFFPTGLIIRYIEFGFGVLFLIEYTLRFSFSRHKGRFPFRLVNLLDVILIASLFLTSMVPNLAFLRVFRALQILRAYKFFGKRFDHHNAFVYRNFEVITSALILVLFLLIMSSVVYVQQVTINPSITHYIDALYYTITAVTTTGFGDIVMVGHWGKLLSVIIMILGVTLFFRLVKSLFVPRQLYSVCGGCGKDHHALDTHFCGSCGHKIKNRYFIDRMQKHKDDF